VDVEAAPAGRRRWPDPALTAFAVATLLGVAQALAAWAGGDGGAAAVILRASVPYALALAVVVALSRDGRRLAVGATSRWAAGLAVAGVVLSLWLLARFAVALPDAMGADYGFYRLKLRITSPLGDHNTAAGLLVPPLVAGALLVVRSGSRGSGRGRAGVWVATVVTIALGLAATLSRGVVVVLAGVVLVAVVLASRRRLAGVLAGALALVVLGLGAASVALDTAAPPGTAAPGPAGQAGAGPLGASVLGRVDLWVRGIEVGAAHPVAGVGVGRFAEAAADLPQPNDHAHQAFAQAFAEGGVLLLTAAVLVVGTLAWRAWRLPAGPRRDLVLLGGLGLIAHAQLEILAGRLGYEVLLALLVALAAVPVADAPARPAPGGAVDGPAVADG